MKIYYQNYISMDSRVEIKQSFYKKKYVFFSSVRLLYKAAFKQQN